MQNKAMFVSILILIWMHFSVNADEPVNDVAQLKQAMAGSVVSIVPHFLAKNGLRFDWEYARDTNHWIQVSPVIFLNDNPYGGSVLGRQMDRQTGIGLHLYHKYYPGEGYGITRTYISYGLVWHFNHLQYNSKDVIGQSGNYTRINQYGADVLIGMVALTHSRLTVDVFTGLGIRFADFTSDSDTPELFNNGFGTLGFAGNTLLLGIKIGYFFERHR